MTAICQQLNIQENVRMRVKNILKTKILVENGAKPWKSYTQKEISPADDDYMLFDLQGSSLSMISQEMPVQNVETDLLSQIL